MKEWPIKLDHKCCSHLEEHHSRQRFMMERPPPRKKHCCHQEKNSFLVTSPSSPKIFSSLQLLKIWWGAASVMKQELRWKKKPNLYSHSPVMSSCTVSWCEKFILIIQLFCIKTDIQSHLCFTRILKTAQSQFVNKHVRSKKQRGIIITDMEKACSYATQCTRPLLSPSLLQTILN